MKDAVVFFLRHANDLDHICPVIWKFSSTVPETACVVVWTGRREANDDFRFRLLLDRQNVFLRCPDSLFSGGTTGKSASPADVAAAIAEPLFRDYNVKLLVFDWIHLGMDEYQAFAQAMLNIAAKHGCAGICIPHGDHCHTGNMLRTREIGPDSTGIYSPVSVFDALVVPNEHCADRYRQYVAPARMSVLGSPRYNSEWISILDNTAPLFKCADDTGRRKIAMFLRHRDYPQFWEEIYRTIRLIAQFRGAHLAVVSHTRGTEHLAAVYPDLQREVQNLTFVDGAAYSGSITRWADVVLDLGTSVAFESIAMDKTVICPEYLHATRAVTGSYQPRAVAWCRDELYEMIAGVIENPNRTFRSAAERARFIREMLHVPDRDVLNRYARFISDCFDLKPGAHAMTSACSGQRSGATEPAGRSLMTRLIELDQKCDSLARAAEQRIADRDRRLADQTDRSRSLTKQLTAFAEQHVRARWRAITEETGQSQIYLFGAGAHTAWLLATLDSTAVRTVHCVVDDNAPGGTHVEGIPIVSPESLGRPPETVVLSSDMHQAAFAARCHALWGDNVRIFNLYAGLPPGPYPKQTPPAKTRAKPHNARPAVSLVLPVGDSHPSLSRCIDAALLQDAPATPFEVVIVDNTTRGTAVEPLLNTRPSAGPILKFIRESQRGVTAARNAGARAARGSVVAFIASDIIVPHDFVARLSRLFSSHNGPDMACGPVTRDATSRLPRWLLDNFSRLWNAGDEGQQIRRGFMFNGCNMAFRSDILRNAGFFGNSEARNRTSPERIAEYALTWQLADEHSDCRYIPELAAERAAPSFGVLFERLFREGIRHGATLRSKGHGPLDIVRNVLVRGKWPHRLFLLSSWFAGDTGALLQAVGLVGRVTRAAEPVWRPHIQANAEDRPEIDISIAICTYNRATVLDRCLAHIATLDYDADRLEVLVVDNGSTDNTPQLVMSWRESMPSLRYLRENEPGLSAARNRAAMEARGSIVTYIDDDSLVQPGYAAAVVQQFRANPQVKCVVGRVTLAPAAPLPTWVDANLRRAFAEFEAGDRPRFIAAGGVGANMSFRREVFAKNGLFNPALGRKGKNLLSMEDRDFLNRVQARSPEACLYEPRAHVRHVVQCDRLTRRFFVRRNFWQRVSESALAQYRNGADSLFSKRIRRAGTAVWTMIAETPRRLLYLLVWFIHDVGFLIGALRPEPFSFAALSQYARRTIANAQTRLRRSLDERAKRKWRTLVGTRSPACRLCGGPTRTRSAYGRLFVECADCGLIFCGDYPEFSINSGMGLTGSWGGIDVGGEREDFLVRMLSRDFGKNAFLLYGVGSTLAFPLLLREGFNVYGCDLSRSVISYRRREFGRNRFFHADRLRRMRNRFDAITACEVIEHFSRPSLSIGRLVNSLTEGGIICGTTNFYPGGSLEDGQATGYMSLRSHVVYWSEQSLRRAFAPYGMSTVFFKMVNPGSGRPGKHYTHLFPNKRVFFASSDSRAIERLKSLKQNTPVLPIDMAAYPHVAYRRARKRAQLARERNMAA